MKYLVKINVHSLSVWIPTTLTNDSQIIVANELNKYFLSVVNEVFDRQAVPSNIDPLFFKNIFNLKREKCSIMLGPILKEDLLKAVH